MQFPKLGIAAALSITVIAASAAPAPPKPSRWQQHVRKTFKNMAPADAYFGSMKMTYIGMNNTFRDTAIQSGEHTTDAGIISRVSFAEDALADWAAKYPRDPQLARTYFLAFAVERKIWLKPNQDRAWEDLNRLVRDFPASYFGKLLKRDLAIGFTEHYYATPAPCTPAPSPPADAESSPSPSPSASPSPSPSTTPSPAVTATSPRRGLRVQIIPVPCVPPPTPTPTPLPSPSASASPELPESPAPEAS